MCRTVIQREIRFHEITLFGQKITGDTLNIERIIFQREGTEYNARERDITLIAVEKGHQLLTRKKTVIKCGQITVSAVVYSALGPEAQYWLYLIFIRSKTITWQVSCS